MVEDTIYCCSDDFAQKVLPLLQNMGITAERSYYNIMHPLFMAPVDYRSFCRYVLPEVEPYVKILTENFDIQSYQPIPAQFQCYLTMPETAEADACKVEHDLSDETFACIKAYAESRS